MTKNPIPATAHISTTTLVAAILLIGVGAWAFAPTIICLVGIWNAQPDYSHGYLVAPLAILFLWMRRQTFPSESVSSSWFGIVLLVVSGAIRIAGEVYATETADGWALVIWVAGSVLALFGWKVFRWSLPCVAFLIFMVPLPFRFEHMLSVPLQRVAATISTFVLQCLTQPAFAEGTTIWVGDQQLEIEQACSGLRIFVGILALAFAYIIAAKRELWEIVFLLASVIPIALVANATRIVVSGILFHNVSSDAAKHFSHDVAGWLMIPLAAALFAVTLWYMNCLVREVKSVDVTDLVQQQRAKA